MSNCSCVNVLFRFELKGNSKTKPNLHLAIYELKAKSTEMLTNQRTLYKTTRKSRVISLKSSSIQDVCDGLVWIKEWLLVDFWLLPLSFPFGFALPVSLIITVHGWKELSLALTLHFLKSHDLNYAKFYMLELHYFYQPLSSQLFFYCISHVWYYFYTYCYMYHTLYFVNSVYVIS